jgi:hypothetical protein
MKLLLVEDDKEIATAVKRGLEAEGFAVEVAFDGHDGLWMEAGFGGASGGLGGAVRTSMRRMSSSLASRGRSSMAGTVVSTVGSVVLGQLARETRAVVAM